MVYAGPSVYVAGSRYAYNCPYGNDHMSGPCEGGVDLADTVQPAY